METNTINNLYMVGHLPPLVIAINIPYNSLDKDLVFIHCWKKIVFNESSVNNKSFETIYLSQETKIWKRKNLPIKAPRMNGVSLVKTMELVGRFPSKTFQERDRGYVSIFTHLLVIKHYIHTRILCSISKTPDTRNHQFFIS